MTSAPLEGLDLKALGSALAEMGADGWLLFDFRHVNPIAGRIVGAGSLGLGTRRLFVLLPSSGAPIALADFPGEIRPYSSWRELHAGLRALVANRTVAMEVSALDAVPYLDRVPSGVVELVQSLGGRVVSSAPLVTRFAARWSAAELDGHRHAAAKLAEIAREALVWAGQETARGVE